MAGFASPNFDSRPIGAPVDMLVLHYTDMETTEAALARLCDPAARVGAQHSQDWTSLVAHIPGLKVCFPATPYDAKGLMNSALQGTDPVMNGQALHRPATGRFLGDLTHFLDGHGSVGRKIETNDLLVLSAVANRAYENAYSSA